MKKQIILLVLNIRRAQKKTEELQTYVTYAHRFLHAASAERGTFPIRINAWTGERKLVRFQMRLFGFSVAGKSDSEVSDGS